MAFKLYSIKENRLRKLIIKLVKNKENGEFYSKTLRKIVVDPKNWTGI